MVKSDVRRDYYADLGLAPSAESEDIKKQFRKLALKYHPDRNPGKELEFNAKFQAIQAAHEILGDPQQRLKYDTDRLRAGYGKFYGPPKANTSRKAPANPYTSSPTAKAQSQKPFPGRPTSFQNGPSTGAQRYASYARAAPQQSWQKKQDEGQTRADAFRGFQDMKGNANMPGWAQFDPRTGRSGHPGAAPRANATPNGQSARPKSAYEYFKTSPKTAGPDPSRSQSTKKKQGFAPRGAGGDEPMATNTSAYSNTPRGERFQASDPFFESVPSPTARKSAAAFGTRRAPDLERSSSKYATSGGERTFFSSAGLGRSPSARASPGSPKSRSRTNPSSPSSPRSSRHRSASPHTKANRDRAFSSSTSSSDTEDDGLHPYRKPKAVPKSRLRPNQKFADFRPQQDWNPGTGHDSDSAASPRNVFAGKYSSGPKDPFVSSSKNADVPQNGTFKSSSHGNLRTEFSAQDWQGAFQQGFSFFAPSPAEKDTSRPSSNRGRTAARNPAWAGQSADSSSQGSPRPASTSQQPTPFTDMKFSADDWVERFKNLSWAVPNTDGAKPKANPQPSSSRSPKKQTRHTKSRSVPQSASVSTEADEAKATVDGDSGRDSSKGADGDVEAMDVDDERPAKNLSPNSRPKKTPGKRRQSKSRPSSSEDSKGKSPKSKSKPKSHLFSMKNLEKTVPFTNTNSGGIDDLQDIEATLPSESRAKNPTTTIRDIRPRELNCPNPPRRPRRPTLIPVSAGSQQLALPRNAWDRYVAEMNTYMREWNDFNRRFLRHFSARQDAIETGLAPNWINSVGDSARIKIDGQDDLDDGNTKGDGDESDEELVSGSAKGGYSAYLRGLEEDVKVRKHWEVACELHQECIVELGQMREWILNGGKVV
ncbi:hypothetical protein AWENTII_010503 [Aspergillus wentii]